MTYDDLMLPFPFVPTELKPVDVPVDFGQQCEILWAMVLDELLDPDYRSRQHHNTGTHDKGCRGLLCQKSYREHPRRKTPVTFSGYTPREQRIYDPILELYHTVAKHRIRTYQQVIYKELSK